MTGISADVKVNKPDGYEKLSVPGGHSWHWAKRTESGDWKTVCGLRVVNRYVSFRRNECRICKAMRAKNMEANAR